MPPNLERGTEDMHRRHVWIADDDWDWLGELYRKNIGISGAIRLMIKDYRKRIEAKAAAQARGLSPRDIPELDEIVGGT